MLQFILFFSLYLLACLSCWARLWLFSILVPFQNTKRIFRNLISEADYYLGDEDMARPTAKQRKWCLLLLLEFPSSSNNVPGVDEALARTEGNSSLELSGIQLLHIL